MNFREVILRAIAEPVANEARIGNDRISGLTTEAYIGLSNDDVLELGADATAIMTGTAGFVEDERQLVWVIISTPEESLAFAIGTATDSIEQLNQQARLFAEEVEGWLSETRLAWGAICSVPRPVISSQASWDASV